SDEGILNSWSLSFNSSEPFRTTGANGNYQFGNLNADTYIIREEAKPGWTQVPPASTTIPGATWTSAHWAVTVDAVSVPNVNFGNFTVINLAGDYNRDGIVNGSDYILWRRTAGSHVHNFSGAEGDGSATIDQADFTVWRLHYGQTFPGSGSGSGLAAVAAASA